MCKCAKHDELVTKISNYVHNISNIVLSLVGEKILDPSDTVYKNYQRFIKVTKEYRKYLVDNCDGILKG